MRGSVYNRGSKNKPNWVWFLYLGKDENGKPIRPTKSGFKTRREAEEACNNALSAYQEQQRLKSQNAPASADDAAKKEYTLEEWVDWWFEHHASREFSPKTLERSRELARYVMPNLGHIKIAALDSMTIQAELNRLLDAGGKHKRTGAVRPLAVKTVRSIRGVLFSALDRAKAHRKIAANPIKAVKLAKPTKKEQRALDFDEFEKLLARARTSWIYPLLKLAGDTGCRRGELLALEWRDVDFEAGVLYITKSLEQTKVGGLRLKSTKNRESREIELSAETLDALREHKANQDKLREQAGELWKAGLDLVFADEHKNLGDYRKPDSVSAMAARMIKRAGFPDASLHNLRHTHGSHMLAIGESITDVSERLGHKDSNITLGVYSHSLPSSRKGGATRLEEARRKARQSSGGG